MENVEFVYTLGMDEAEIREKFDAHHAGVLSLASDGDAYAIPVAFHYEPDVPSLVFRLTDDGRSDKITYVESTEQACFILWGTDAEDESWSIMAIGPLRELDRDDHRYDATEINRTFSEVRVFDETIDDMELRLYEMRFDELTGRRTSA